MYFHMNVRGNWSQKILVKDGDAEDARCHVVVISKFSSQKKKK